MRIETSKQPENIPSPSSRRIAEGKRKGESHSEALSLQDVFSDSGSATGNSQKTSSPAYRRGHSRQAKAISASK